MELEIDVLNYYNSKGEAVSKEEFWKEKKIFMEHAEIKYRTKIKEIVAATAAVFDVKEKLRIVYNYFIDNVQYDYEVLKTVDEKGTVSPISHPFWNKWGFGSHEKYTPLLVNRGVCFGIAAAFQDICSQMGIDCEMVHGKTVIIDEKEVALNHTWNKVKIGDKELFVDATYGILNRDKELDEMAYFLIDQEQLETIGPHHDFADAKSKTR